MNIILQYTPNDHDFKEFGFKYLHLIDNWKLKLNDVAHLMYDMDQRRWYLNNLTVKITKKEEINTLINIFK
jgi:hypothetical protein